MSNCWSGTLKSPLLHLHFGTGRLLFGLGFAKITHGHAVPDHDSMSCFITLSMWGSIRIAALTLPSLWHNSPLLWRHSRFYPSMPGCTGCLDAADTFQGAKYIYFLLFPRQKSTNVTLPFLLWTNSRHGIQGRKQAPASTFTPLCTGAS